MKCMCGCGAFVWVYDVCVCVRICLNYKIGAQFNLCAERGFKTETKAVVIHYRHQAFCASLAQPHSHFYYFGILLSQHKMSNTL